MEAKLTEYCKISRFNEDGLARFQAVLERGRADAEYARWTDEDTIRTDLAEILQNQQYVLATEFPGRVDLDKKFSNRYELGCYINQIVQNIPIERDKELLSWLAAAYLDQLCSADKSTGTLKIGDIIRYIPDINNPRRYYRHLILAPVMLVNQLGDDAKWLLLSAPSIHADTIEQSLSRPYMIANRVLMDVSKRLYFDGRAGRPKQRAFTKDTPGGFQRLARDIVPQFEMNHDLQLMRPEKVIEMLPQEFSVWL